MSCYIPETIKKAELCVYDMSGSRLKCLCKRECAVFIGKIISERICLATHPATVGKTQKQAIEHCCA